MGLLEDLTNSILNYTTKTIRHFTAFVFIILALGVLAGVRAAAFGNAELERLAWMLPLLFALLSYMYAEIAIVFFLVFALLILIL